jgi:hypothetical protein
VIVLVITFVEEERVSSIDISEIVCVFLLKLMFQEFLLAVSDSS